ncbi:MAG: Rne/Rng family ribonuclease [Bacillota bacterium]
MDNERIDGTTPAPVSGEAGERSSAEAEEKTQEQPRKKLRYRRPRRRPKNPKPRNLADAREMADEPSIDDGLVQEPAPAPVVEPVPVPAVEPPPENMQPIPVEAKDAEPKEAEGPVREEAPAQPRPPKTRKRRRTKGAAKEQARKESAVEDPITKEPVANEPIAKEPTAEEPAAREPATVDKPVSSEAADQEAEPLPQAGPPGPQAPAHKGRKRRSKRQPAGGKPQGEGAGEVRPLVSREILVSAAKDETRVALVEDGAVVEFYVERPSSQKIAGSIFLGKVTNVLPGMQAAFIDIGEEKNAFLYVDDAILPPNLEDTDAAPELKSRKKKTIAELVKPGQEVMVQVVKEAIGTKGARVTRHVTFPGRYMVLMPTVSYVGVSRRIVDDEERKRLRQIARDLKPKDMGIIIRTVAEKKTKEELERDLQFLLKVWEKVQKRARSSKAPCLIHSDLGLTFRVVRDELNQETTRMLVDDVNTYSRILDLLESVSPEMKERVIYYRDREYPLFQLYGVDAAVEKALGRQVWLKSGGYLVIDKTEALTVIDVNTGRYVGNKNLADTVFKINMEATEEIARQLRIRDIGGIIVVDFIDMEIPEHRQRLLAEMERQLRHDHTKTVVVGLTGLGLVEMTRKKVRQSIDAVMMRMCPYCGGKGVVLSEETVAGRVRREIRRILGNSQSEAILVEVHPGVASYLIGPGGANLKELEKETGRSIFVRGNDALHLEEMNVKAVGTREEIANKAIPVQVGDILEVVIEEVHEKNPQDGIARREGFVIDVEGAGGKIGQRVVIEVTSAHRTFAKARTVTPQVKDRVS